MSVILLLMEVLAAQKPRLLPATKRASIALILRVNGFPESCYPKDDAGWDRFRDSPVATSSDLDNTQLFFIKRATRAGDPWSGNVAFPGGKKDATDVDELHTAVRETLEECGIDLSQGNFKYLGRLDDRPVYSGGKERSGFVLTPFVFVQLCSRTPPLRLQPSEVAAARWVPLSSLLREGAIDPKGIHKAFPLFPAVQALPAGLRWVLGLDRVYFPAIDLPEQRVGSTAWSAEVAGSERAGGDGNVVRDGSSKEQVGSTGAGAAAETATVTARAAVHGADVLMSDRSSDDPDISTHFRLWGMTLHATADLLALAATHPAAPTPLKQHRALAWPPFRLNGMLANAVMGTWLGGVEVREWLAGTRRWPDVRGLHVTCLLLLGIAPAAALAWAGLAAMKLVPLPSETAFVGRLRLFADRLPVR